MSVDYGLIGQRIKIKRKAADKTQEQLAEELGVTVGYVSQLERGITKINLDILSEIGSILNCDIDFFVAGTAMKEPGYLQSELMEKYRMLNQTQKKMLLDFADMLIKNGGHIK